MSELYSISVSGRPYVKKNGARRFGKTLVYSKNYTQWARLATIAINKAKRPDAGTIDKPVNLFLKFHFKNRAAEADVSNLIEGIQDVLVTTNILKDDKLVIKVTAEKLFTGDERTDVSIWERA